MGAGLHPTWRVDCEVAVLIFIRRCIARPARARHANMQRERKKAGDEENRRASREKEAGVSGCRRRVSQGHEPCFHTLPVCASASAPCSSRELCRSHSSPRAAHGCTAAYRLRRQGSYSAGHGVIRSNSGLLAPVRTKLSGDWGCAVGVHGGWNVASHCRQSLVGACLCFGAERKKSVRNME